MIFSSPWFPAPMVKYKEKYTKLRFRTIKLLIRMKKIFGWTKEELKEIIDILDNG